MEKNAEPADFISDDQMSGNADDLFGMNPAEAKEYILNFITTLKLTEQHIAAADKEKANWRARVDLAQSKGQDDLAAEADRELTRVTEKRERIIAEAVGLKTQIEKMRDQLPALAARVRSVDADLLEQELLMAAGYMPGDEEKARNERDFRELEKAASADAALEALKAKMKKAE